MLFSDPGASPTETIAAELRDYPEWHRGRGRYGVWMIPVDDPLLLNYIQTVQQQLADLLHPSPQRQPHLTLFVCGFEQSVCVDDDDFSPQQLSSQVDGLNQVRGSVCSLSLGRPDSFASAAFIPVDDSDGRLSRWRDALNGVAREIRQATYIPHITLGLYKRRVGADVVRQRLASFDAPPMSLAVTQLHYATYDARTQFGRLESQHRLMLDPVDG